MAVANQIGRISTPPTMRKRVTTRAGTQERDSPAGRGEFKGQASRLTKDGFEMFLAALDEDREKAGERYEVIRGKLLDYFGRRGCDQPDAYADEVLDRAARKMYAGAVVPDVGRYCYGIARLVMLETLARRKKTREAFEQLNHLRQATKDGEGDEQLLTLLEYAMSRLSAEDRDMIIAYYQVDGRDRIEGRRRLAEQRGVAPNALRIRAHRIRAKLQEHFSSLIESKETGPAHHVFHGAGFGRRGRLPGL